MLLAIVVLLALVLLVENGYLLFAFFKFKKELEKDKLSEELPIENELVFIAHPTRATCQFCKQLLTKIYRSNEGYYCCESCSRIVLNQQPKEENVITFH